MGNHRPYRDQMLNRARGLYFRWGVARLSCLDELFGYHRCRGPSQVNAFGRPLCDTPRKSVRTTSQQRDMTQIKVDVPLALREWTNSWSCTGSSTTSTRHLRALGEIAGHSFRKGKL